MLASKLRALRSRGLVILAMTMGIAACTQAPTRDPMSADPILHDSSVDQLMRVADYIKGQGNQAMAVGFYQQIATAHDVEVSVLLPVAEALRSAGSLESAADAYRRALAIESNNLTALRGLADIYLSLGRLEQSIPILEATIAADEDDASGYRKLGAALDLFGRHDLACDVYRDALPRFEGDLDLKSNYALSLAMGGRFDKAMEVAIEIGKTPGNSRQHQRNMVLIFAISGHTEEAERYGETIGLGGEVPLIIDQAKVLSSITDSAERAQSLGAVPNS